MKTKLIRLSLFAILVIAIGIAISYRDQFDAAALEAWLQGAGAAGPILFILIYAAAAVLFLPGSVLTLAGGALFGPVWGTLFNLIGATLGATLAFLIARYLAADWVERKTGGRLKQLKQGVEKEGWRFVAFVRLVPLFPFNLLNYALGLTRINLAHYIIASFICMFPGALAYTYLGYAGREAIAGGEGLIQKILLAIGLLVLVAFLPRWIGRLRRGPSQSVEQLKQRLDQNDTLLVLDVRSEEEFTGELGHIHGALNIPVEQLSQRLDELNDYLESPIVTICRTDKRSAKAVQLLAQRGFADVHVIQGGMIDWNKHDYPVE
ncbi:VTT domain-containing protein [Thiohalophilus sp.]|uniref:VTT domain-containing protein n=1 Tax=Thiohalophilus sp. TaxID=3028392 RepID=UPI002ACEAD83|nr:VTT domain-containing protein [Thiohalophilus sp.]MDZ7803153.1 VTT domain-containing protein [Thiohalophilus sp.]